MLPGLQIPLVVEAGSNDLYVVGVGAQATGSTSVVVAYPSNIQANDIIFMWVSADSAPSIGTATGFTAETQVDRSNLGVRLFWKRAVGTESGTITVSCSSGAAARGFMVLVRNAVTTGTPYADITYGSGSSSTVLSAACTTFGANWLLMRFMAHASGNGGAMATSSPWEEELDAGTTGCQKLDTYLKPTSGSQAGWSHSATVSDDWIAMTIAVVPKTYTQIADSTRSTSGTQTFTKPPGATIAVIHCIGPGGGGGTGSLNSAGGGGGGGAYARRNAYNVSSLTGLYVDIGGSSSTRVRENNSSGTIACQAPKGGNGSPQTGPPPVGGPGGSGGSGGTGDVLFSGAGGGTGGDTAGAPGGDGGGAAGSTSAGSGRNGGSGFPSGGDGGSGASDADPGLSPGGGGGGAYANVPALTGGGSGADGYVRIKWGTG